MFVRKVPSSLVFIVSSCLAVSSMPGAVCSCLGATVGDSGAGLAVASQPAILPPATVREGVLSVQAQYPIEPKMVLWLPGSMAWPNLRSAPYENPQSKPCTFQTIELSNAYLTARFVPQVGFRLYDLTWNDDPLKRQAFRVMEDLEVEHMYRWEGPGYLVTFGAMKWGFPYHGHITSDHVPWAVRQGVDASGSAWAEGTYTDPDTGIVGTVKAVLPKDAAKLIFTFTCHNPRTLRQAIDYWIDSYAPTDRHIEFAMAASEAITHQSGWNLVRQMFCSWPIQDGQDRRFLRNWDGSQGVFPADLRGDYTAFYSHRRQNGVVRIFPHEKVLGVKFWMPGVGGDWLGEMFGGLDITQDERRYMAAGETIDWQETWYPVRSLGGFDAGNEDVAFRVAADKDATHLHVTATRNLDNVHILVQGEPVRSPAGVARQPAAPIRWESRMSLRAGESVTIDLPAVDKQTMAQLRVTLDGSCKTLAWTESAELLKPSYTDESLDKDRQAYTTGLQSKHEKATATAVAADSTGPAEQFIFRHAGTIGADAAFRFDMPNACCQLDDGTIVVADQSRIKLFKKDLTFDRVLATKGLRWPIGLCVRGKTLFVADSGNSRVVGIDLTNETIVRTIELSSQPAGLVFWREGLAVALPRKSEVIYLDLSQAQPKPQVLAGSADLREPFGLVAAGRRLLVTDPGMQRVVAIGDDGKVAEVASSNQGLSLPSRVAVVDGKTYVLDAGRSQLLRLDEQGGPAQVCLNGRLFGPISLGLPSDMLVDGSDLLVVVADPASLCRVSVDGQILARHEDRGEAWPNARPDFQAFCRRPNGDWLVASMQYNLFWFDRDAKLIRQYGAWGRGDGQFWEVNALACDSAGYTYVSDFFNYRVMRFDPQMQQMTNVDMDAMCTDGVAEPSRWYVRGLAVDGADHLAAAVCGGQGVYLYSPAPRNDLLAVLKPYEPFRPMAVAFDAKGNLFVLDDEAAKVIVYTAKDLAKVLGKEGSAAAAAGLAPMTWALPPDSCALSIVADEKGGCYVGQGGKEVPGRKDPAGEIVHLDAEGKIERTVSSAYATRPRHIQLVGDHVVVANGNARLNPGINEVRLDGELDPKTNGKILIGHPEPAAVPGMFRSVAGILHVGGPDGHFELIDPDRKIKAIIDPVSLAVRKEEPFSTDVSFFNPSPDGTMILHKWRGDRYLWSAKDGQVSKITFGDLKNPPCLIHDPRGGWWVTVYEKDRKQAASKRRFGTWARSRNFHPLNTA